MLFENENEFWKEFQKLVEEKEDFKILFIFTQVIEYKLYYSL